MLQTTLCYIEQDEKYLMLHRIKKENDVNRDKWIGIGGKFAERESPEECILREALEETGLTLTKLRYCGILTFLCDHWPAEHIHLFHATEFTGEMQSCDEGVLEWIPKAELLSLPMWEGDKIFLKLMDEQVPFFSLLLEYAGDQLIRAVLNGERIK